MRNVTGRLPLIVVLVVVAASAAWTTVDARSREWTRSVRSQAPASTVFGSSRYVRPADGEPDVLVRENRHELDGAVSGAEVARHLQ